MTDSIIEQRTDLTADQKRRAVEMKKGILEDYKAAGGIPPSLPIESVIEQAIRLVKEDVGAPKDSSKPEDTTPIYETKKDKEGRVVLEKPANWDDSLGEKWDDLSYDKKKAITEQLKRNQQQSSLLEDMQLIDSDETKATEDVKRAFQKIVGVARGIRAEFVQQKSDGIADYMLSKGQEGKELYTRLKHIEDVVDQINLMNKDKDSKTFDDIGEIRRMTNLLASTLGDTPEAKAKFLENRYIYVLKKRNLEDYVSDTKDIECLEDFLAFISLQAPDVYQPGAEFQIIDENGVPQVENVILLLEDQIWEQSDLFDNGKIEAYNALAYYTTYRQVTLGEGMMNTLRTYFRKKKVEPELIKDGLRNTVKESKSYHTDEAYTRLYYHLLVMLSTSNNIHNPHYQFIQQMKNGGQGGQDFLKLMGELFGPNENTYTSRLIRYMNLPTEKAEMDAYMNPQRDAGEAEKSLYAFKGTGGLAYMRGISVYKYLVDFSDGKLWADDAHTRANADNLFLQALGGEKSQMAFFRAFMEATVTQNDLFQTYLKTDLRSKFMGLMEFIGENDGLFQAIKNKKDVVVKNKSGEEINYGKADEIFREVLKTARLNSANVQAIMDAASGNGLGAEMKFAIALLEKGTGFKRGDVNVYKSEKTKSPTLLNMLEASIPAALAVEYNLGGINDAKTKEALATAKKRAKISGKYWAHFAYLTTYWTGIASRNDTSPSSRNFMTVITRLNQYLVENHAKTETGDLEDLYALNGALTPLEEFKVTTQKIIEEKDIEENIRRISADRSKTAEEREKLIAEQKARIGNAEDKHLSLDNYIEGSLRGDFDVPADVVGSDQERIQGLGGDQYRKQDYRFVKDSMNLYVGWHLKGMLTLRDFITLKHGLNLGELMKIDAGSGRLVISDPSKVDQIMRLLIDARNALAKPELNLDLDEKLRVLVPVHKEKDEYGKPIKDASVVTWEYRDLTIKEIMLDKNVLNLDVNHGHFARHEKLGEKLARQYFLWSVVADIRRHRGKFWTFKNNMREQWHQEEIQWIHEFLENFPYKETKKYIKTGKKIINPDTGKEEDEKISVGELLEGLAEDEDWKEIAKAAGVTPLKLYGGDYSAEAGGTPMAILWLMFKEMLKNWASFK